MVKVKVIKQFRDISDFAHVHFVGEVLEVTAERAKELEKLGLAVPFVAEQPKKNKKNTEE